ncbi:MAG: glycoside hydrolase family 26 protein [Streptosporangiaceae bacterium]
MRGTRIGLSGLAAAAVAVTAVLAAHGARLAADAVPQGTAVARSAAVPQPAVPDPRAADPAAQAELSAKPGSYLGVFVPGAPESYAGLAAFSAATGVRPGLEVYYSGWYEPFSASFAATAASHGAVAVVQINPTHISLAAIVAGDYDTYLRDYALSVRAYGGPVVLSFGHEMNGPWYSWGSGHDAPALFVAAWRHLVTLFRVEGAHNVTWLWTVNVANPHAGIPYPAPWWPGRAYVTWVGIDGYFYAANQKFDSVFARTIQAVRALSDDPVLVAETSVIASSAGQATEIPDMFAGVHRYGLLGLVWFDAVGTEDWRLRSGPAQVAFSQAAQRFALMVPPAAARPDQAVTVISGGR